MTTFIRSRNRFRAVTSVLAVAGTVGALCLTAPAAQAATTTLVPTALTNVTGNTGGQGFAVLGVQDQSGTTDTWAKYVEFGGQLASTNYSGYATYALPGTVTASSITGLQVNANYRGPDSASQLWTFSLYNYATSAWVTVGTNVTAPSWGSWKLLGLPATGTLANYVSGTGALRVQLTSNNASDNTDIDYLAIAVTSGTATADTTAPSTPTALTVGTKTATSVALSWTASTDNVAVTGYEIFAGASTTPVATTTGTGVTATVSGLTASTAYSFTVKARDAAGNRSAASAAVSATTNAAAADTTAPSTPTALTVGTKTATSVALSWTASTDNVAVTGYEIFAGASTTPVATTTGTGVTATVSGLTASTAYSFTVKARDAAGNRSAASAAVSATTNAAAADTTAPSTPTALTVGTKTATSVALSWSASTDNVAVTGYEIFAGASTTPVATTTGTGVTATVSGLTASTAYSFTVKARDAAGNRSATSAAVSATTNAAAGGFTLPPANGVFDYQLGGPYTPIASVTIVDRDHTATAAAGKYNVCYLNAYQSQPGDSGTWPSDVFMRTPSGGFVEDAGWPGEYIFDTSTPALRTKIMLTLGAWMQDCATKGFSAIEPDNLDTWTRSGSNTTAAGGVLTQAQNVELAKLMVAKAHSLGLAIAQKNTAELLSIGKSQIGFDFAVVEECQKFTECDGFTNIYGTQVYEIEYSAAGIANFNSACTARGATISVTYRDKNVVPFGTSGYVFQNC